MRQTIQDIVSDIAPFDETEASHQQQVLEWIQSGAPLFRVAKPDTPPMHLVSYFVLYDVATQKLMLIDHAKAHAWLPTGGHVEPDEHPRDAAIREAKEELDIDAAFTTPVGDKPLFITATVTKGFGNHTDVSLWYVIEGDSTATITYDPEEMNDYQWLRPEEILSMDIALLDPHMHRFIRKLQQVTA